MQKQKITTEFTFFESIEELSFEIKHLMQQAISAREEAYAPYSKFKVGAAVLLQNKTIVLGNNQENAAYPSGLCAERIAVFSAGANYPEQLIKAIAITASSGNKPVENPVPPCGACRQALAEYEIKQKQPMAVYFMGEKGKIAKAESIRDLLPLWFDGSSL